MKNNPKLTTYIIIVTYNGMKWLVECLKSTEDYPVIIVDNGSTDGTIDFLKLNYPEVVLLEQETNLGFGKANNLGISYALKKGAKFVFLLNQDAYLAGNAVEVLLNANNANPGYGILSPVHLDGQGEFLDRKFFRYVGLNANPKFFSDFVKQKKLEDIYEVPFVNAAGWLLSRKCLTTVGGFDPIFFHYGEDDNYCQRVRYHQLKIGVVPAARLSHDRVQTLQPVKPEDGQKYFFQKENLLKANFGNINKNWKKEFQVSFKNLQKNLLKALLKLQFKTAKVLYKEIEIHKKISCEIKKSRRINKQFGSHYLDI